MLSKSVTNQQPSRARPGGTALLIGGLSALLASTCCLGPLALLALGISGAWISNLSLLEPYRPGFIALAVMALLFAWQRIWRPATVCIAGEVCALPPVRRAYQWLFGLVALLVLVALAFPFLAPLFY